MSDAQKATITTKTGTVYELDLSERTVRWQLRDGSARVYTGITDHFLELGWRFVFAGTRDLDGKPTSRMTTVVQSIEWHS